MSGSEGESLTLTRTERIGSFQPQTVVAAMPLTANQSIACADTKRRARTASFDECRG